MHAPCYSSMDEALAMLAAYGPDLRNGLTNHAPMAAEALCALGRPEAVIPWVERYRAGMLPRPAASERITATNWRSALAQERRVADWSGFFAIELQAAPWRAVLDDWVGRLAPGICASATHGVIRTGHAARALAEAETASRLRELADGLAYWAANYQELPSSALVPERTMEPREAIKQVALVPAERRRFSGTITSSLAALQEFPDFAPVIGLIDVSGDASLLVAELTELFARLYLANAHDTLTAIVFIHGVTSVAALGHLLPHLNEATARQALRFAWQTSCALYATFGTRAVMAAEIEPPRADADTLVDMAVTHGDEHVIKFAEVCLRQHAHNPSPAYVAAARHAMDMLPPALRR